MKKFFIFSILCLLMGFGLAPNLLAQDNDCMITTLPFTEGFENVNSGIPACFTRNPLGIYQVNNMMQPYVDTYQPHSGNHALRAFNNSYNESSPNVPTLVFPELGNQFDMANMVLEFWAYTAWNNDPYFVVGVMDDPDDFSTFTTVQTASPSASDSYTKFTVYFTQYTGSGRYIAIKFANTPGVFGSMCIDDISLTQSAECGPVQYLSLDNVNGTEATIEWHPNAVGTANWYNVTLVNLNNDAVEVSTTTYDTSYTFTGLSFSTQYRAFVSVHCSGGLESSSDSVDFSTLIQPVEVPYFQNFEGDTSDYVPYFYMSGAGGNQWYFGSATGVPSPDATTTHAMYISADSGLTNTYDDADESDAYAVFNVTFPNDPLEYHLSFDYKVKGHHSGYMAFDYLSVYLLDADQAIPVTGEPSGTPLLFEAANVNDWTHFDVILENVPGTSKQVVFYWYDWGWNNTGEDLNPPAAIDNISVAGISCAQPNLLTASNITTDSATLSWNEAGSATSWIVYYRPENSTDAYTSVTVNDTTSIIISNLIANTQYEFYVVANCGANELSNPSNIATFRTACGPIDVLPFTENFESGLYNTTQYTYIACWDRLNTNPDHFVYVGSGDYYAHGGDHYLDFHYTPSCSNIAILPELGQNINASDLMITFYACHTSYGYSALGTLEVGVMTDKNDTNSFVPVQYINIQSQDAFEYSEQMISLGSYTGNGKYIAFRVSNCDNTSYYIDDVLLEQRPDCMYPLDFHKTGVTNQSATLSWTEFGNATSWNIQYDTTGFILGQGQIVIADSTDFTIGNLTNMTTYDFYVQSNCSDTVSDWIGPVTLTTGVINMPFNSNGVLTTCNAILCDDGGIEGNYSLENISSIVIYPETEGNGLEITGSADLHPGYSNYGAAHLIFFEGVGINNNILADFTGNVSDIEVASSGPITVLFTSYYYTAPGFVLYIKCSTCTPPSNFSVSNIETTSATLSWAGGSGLYAIYLSGDTNAYIITSDTTYQLNGLNVNSNYSVKVRSLCGSDSSFFSPVISFSTNCEPFTVTADNPWVEDFESYAGAGNQPFQCWSRAVVDNTYDAPFVYCGYAPACHSGVNSAELKGDGNLLVLPVFSNDIHDLRLSFWATSTNPTFGTLEVGVLTDINNPESFEFLAFTGQPGPRGTDSSGNGNFMGPFDFHNVQASNGRIALRYLNSNYSSASWNLDDFIVEIAPTCYAPSSVDVGNISATEATVVWPVGYEETQWALQYKQATESNWSTEIPCNSTTYVLSNLVPSTLYQVRIKSVCSVDEVSDWSIIEEFMTLPGTGITEPTVVTNPAGDITQHSATLYGTITEPGNQTIIARGFEWKATGADNYTQVTTGSSNILMFGLSGLNANTEYTYRAFATTTNTTTYGNDETFTTLPDDTPDPCNVPTGLTAGTCTEESISISWDDDANVNSWNIQYRPVGGTLASATATTNSYTITGLTPETEYQIQVQADCGDGNLSEWSTAIVASTTVGIENHLLNNISLYPNPANDVVNVQCTMYNVQSIEVIDVYGKVINTLTVTDNPTQINVANLAAGMYFVRVTMEEGVVTKSFVKK